MIYTELIYYARFFIEILTEIYYKLYERILLVLYKYLKIKLDKCLNFKTVFKRKNF